MTIKEKGKRIYFGNVKDLEAFLRKNTGWAETDMMDLIQHEIDHFKSAVELGYQPRYFAGLKIDGKRVFYLGVEIPGLKNEDRKKIFLAPQQPSYIDIEMADGEIK